MYVNLLWIAPTAFLPKHQNESDCIIYIGDLRTLMTGEAPNNMTTTIHKPGDNSQDHIWEHIRKEGNRNVYSWDVNSPIGAELGEAWRVVCWLLTDPFTAYTAQKEALHKSYYSHYFHITP